MNMDNGSQVSKVQMISKKEREELREMAQILTGLRTRVLVWIDVGKRMNKAIMHIEKRLKNIYQKEE